jgi:hypothetical protein
MQAATQFNSPQISNPYLSFQGNLNTLFGGGAQSQLSRGAGSNNSSSSSSQMSNMLSGFSKASFSVFSQTTGNGQSSTYFAQGSITSRGPAANQQPANSGRNDDRGGNSSSTGGKNSTPSRNDYGGK